MGKRVGDVSLYIRNGNDYTKRWELEYRDMEKGMKFYFSISSMLLSMECRIYRWISSSTVLQKVWNEKQDNLIIIFPLRREKQFKHKNYSNRSESLDMMYSHNIFTLITKPTIVTKGTVRIDDNILQQIVTDSKHLHETLRTSISTHHAVFYIPGIASKSSLCDIEPLLGITCVELIYS